MPASARTEQASLTSGGPPAVRPNFLRWIEAVAVVLPTAAFVVIMFVLAFFFSIGLLLGLYQHVRRGDPAWKTDLVLVAGFVGSATGGVIGVLGLTMAVFVDRADLARKGRQWWAVVAALGIGLTTVVGLLGTGIWPRTDLVMVYPLIAAAVVAGYRLPLLILARVRSG